MDERAPGAGQTLSVVREPGDDAAPRAVAGRSSPDGSTLTELPSTSGPEAVAGGTLGRFVIEGRLGSGGMGVVFATRDPVLDRRVAVKLMRLAVDGSSADARRARLLREAQALARLTHPNVVTVFEAGVVGSAVFIAMELVEGGTLRDWMATERPWREVVQVFVAAGRGLAAAHAAGLVHRDFKPANVFIDRDGRVKVGDFGLVGVADSDDPPSVRPAIDSPLHTTLTETGAAMGTPAYMAPEQVQGERVDARADQYAFCVSLHEALTGFRPGAEETGRALPPRLRAIVERGLAADPDARHPSMDVLLGELGRALRNRRGLRLAAAGAGIAAVAAAAAWLATSGPADRVSCGAAGDGFDAVWNDDLRARLQRSFAAVPGHGAQTGARTETAIDQYGARWRSARVDACQATHESGSQSPDLLDRRMRCLDQELAEVRAVLGVLATATDDLARRADGIVATLPDPAACNATRLSAAVPVPDDPRATSILAGVAELAALRARGDWPAARPLATALRREANALGHPGLRAAVLDQYGQVIETDDPAAARAVLEQALADAARADDRLLEASILINLFEIVYAQGDRQPIESLLPMVRAAVARDGVPTTLRLAFQRSEAFALHKLGRAEEALAACEHIAALEEGNQLTSTHCRCVIAIDTRGRDGELRCREALAAAEGALGPDHPTTAGRLTNHAKALGDLGKTSESLALVQRAVAIYEKAFGPDSQELPSLLNVAARKLMTLGRLDEAKATAARSLAIRTKVAAPSPRQLALAHGLLGEILVRRGETGAGIQHLEESLRLTEQALGADHAEMIIPLFNHGDSLQIAGRAEASLAAFTRCSALARKVRGPDHFLHGACLTGQARALLALGRPRQARPLAERAVAILDGAGMEPALVASAHEALGNALAATGDRPRARTELDRAIDQFRQVGPPASQDLERARRSRARL